MTTPISQRPQAHRGILALLLVTGLMAIAALGTASSASALVSGPLGGFGYASAKCVDSTNHVVQLEIAMQADSDVYLPQTVGTSVMFYDPYQGQWFSVLGFTTRKIGELGGHESTRTYFGPFNTTRLPGPKQARWFYASYRWAVNGAWYGGDEMFKVSC